MTYYLLNGMVLGVAAGLTPGPLMALILTESLRGGWPAGFRVALAPLITDTTLITLALLVAAPLPPWGVSAISLVGGGYIVWMAVGTFRSGTPPVNPAGGSGTPMAGAAGTGAAAERGSFARGVATNLLNPYAFLFWLTAGGPILKEAYGAFRWAGPLLFMAPFFVVMIGVNMALALGISRSRQFLQGAAYRYALKGAGAMLALMGLWRMWKGISGL